MAGLGVARYRQRCKYCKDEMDVQVVGAGNPEDRELFNKTGPVKICPKCDGPSPLPTPPVEADDA